MRDVMKTVTLGLRIPVNAAPLDPQCPLAQESGSIEAGDADLDRPG